MSHKSDSALAEEFQAYYLQRATEELGEDLDKVRGADDFKSESAIPLLIRALQQGASMFSDEDKRMILSGKGSGKGQPRTEKEGN